MSEHIINEGIWLMADLHNIAARLSSKTLNIAVIGRARQGKSRLLQTITGLTAQEIPDGNLAFCTGVRSDIINDVSADEAYAVVNFLTERRFINENIVPYFQDLQNTCRIYLLKNLGRLNFLNLERLEQARQKPRK